MGKMKKSFGRNQKWQQKNLKLKDDNLKEDQIIKRMENKLKLNKKKRNNIPKSFMEDGLDYILDMCNEDTRKIAAESEKRLLLHLNEDSDSSNFEDEDEVKPVSSKKNKSKTEEVKSVKQKKVNTTSFEESDLGSEDDYNSGMDIDSADDDDDNSEPDIDTVSKNKKGKKSEITAKKNLKTEKKNFKIEKKNSKKDVITPNNKKTAVPAKKQKMAAMSDSEDEEDFDDFSDEMDSDIGDEIDSDVGDEERDLEKKIDKKEDDGTWEDIYGRKRNKDGSIVTESKQKYIAPALRLKENNSEKNQKLLQLKRQIKGLLNRLAESNMHSIVSQLEELYMSNSRNDMNELIINLMIEATVAPVFTPERLITEQMMCIAILHANVGTEVGAHFIMVLIKKFTEMIEQFQEVENKELDNLVSMICYLYNFKVFGSQLIYQILNKLIDKFTEKEIEIILIILKTAGFRLRKDDPLALKELILNLQQKATTVNSSNSRVKFMLDVLLAIKNNNMNKIPQYDQSHVEHLKKVLKTIIRKGNMISQLNLSLEDLLNADENGKWWIVGSAWSGKAMQSSESTKTADDKPVFSNKIIQLARAQRMNTDIRKNIFCVLMTAEDYLDAFEKLHHLGLKDRQEREIIYVILNCCLQEQNFNPYYAVLLQKFCEYDRKYQMTIQYTLWDKFKMLDSYNNKQLTNIAKLISFLCIQKSLPVSILKVIELGELDKATMKFFKKIMLDILLHESTEACLQVFERIAPSEKLHQFREGLRLFINYFLLKNIKKDKMPPKQMQLLEKRIQFVDKILVNSSSKVAF